MAVTLPPSAGGVPRLSLLNENLEFFQTPIPPALPSLPVMAVKTVTGGLEGELILIAQVVGRLFEQEKKAGHDYASPQPG